ncbi:hypothetical protein LGK97_13930 [Clostridium sp. CS001]|uniref:hypothetical protein n=1 Tax=Clostridium sp. CS001 TaxID=2880648 RepID=UPI001CF56787|nr:hypothetical protein [Clostridium sp. CS001]MCB2290841.1 hypothetical protein [Clostridium sp. CS001]
MSIDGSRPEYLYSIYLKKNPGELSSKIGSMLNEDDIMLERVYKNVRYRRKVDISAIDGKGRRVFCEIQLSKADMRHHLQVVELMDLASEHHQTVIIWISFSLENEYINELIHLLAIHNKKNIELIFLGLNEKVKELLTEINICDQYDQIELLSHLNNIGEHFISTKGIKNYNNNILINTKDFSLNENFSYKQKILIKVIKRLREDSIEYGNVYQYKDVTGNFFGLGSGYGGMDFKINIDKKNCIGIRLLFSNVKSKKVYYYLKQDMEKINNEFDYILTWNDEYQQLSTFLPLGCFSDKNKMILIFSRIVKKYLYGFDKYLKKGLNAIMNSNSY